MGHAPMTGGRDTTEPSRTWRYERGDRSRRNGPLRRRFRALRRKVTAPFVPVLAPRALRLVARTWRVSFTNRERREDVLGSPDGCIAVLWHGRMAVAAPVFRRTDAVILVSRSGDGELADTLLARLGYETRRGSTGKFGADALRDLRDTLERGRAIAITPDGPRGPRHRVNRGPAFLARATGRPILPIGFAASQGARLNSWDRFLLPGPFARVHITFAEPLHVPPGASDEELPRFCGILAERLLAAERQCATSLGVEVDW